MSVKSVQTQINQKDASSPSCSSFGEVGITQRFPTFLTRDPHTEDLVTPWTNLYHDHEFHDILRFGLHIFLVVFYDDFPSPY